jgi:hypothetical protein
VTDDLEEESADTGGGRGKRILSAKPSALIFQNIRWKKSKNCTAFQISFTAFGTRRKKNGAFTARYELGL